MRIEITLCLLHLFLIKQEHVAYLAVGKGIDDGLSDEQGDGVVDGCSETCAKRGKENEQEYVKLAGGSCVVGCGRHDNFRRDGEHGALEGHQEEDGVVVEVREAPLDEC